MFTIKLNTLLLKRLTHNTTYPIIAELFRKKSQASANNNKPTPPPEEEEHQKNDELKEMEDQVYNYFERQRQVDMSFDFSKLKLTAGDTIPETIGKGGFQEVLYWSQLTKSPEQIIQIIDAFNLLAQNKQLSRKAVSTSQVHLDDFKGKVLSTVYLANSLSILQKYSRFAYHYSLGAPQFWEKIEFRSVKIFPTTPAEQGLLIDIGFMMGNFSVGSNIYNHISKLLLEVDLTIDQYVKLYLTFYTLKLGEKVWIDKLLKGLNDKMHQADQQHISALLQPLKQAKQPPETINHNIEKRVVELIDKFCLVDLLKVVGYFGFELETQTTWDIIQSRIDKLLHNKPINDSLLDNLIIKAMNSYRLSADFVRRYIIKPLEESELKRLEEMKLLTLSALSKGLYIYELEGQTKHFEQAISKLIISKVTNDINQITDQDLVKVIQDFNLTRNGNRELYIFFEEVIRIKYLRVYGTEVNRNTIELLLQIYGNSGMCSREMYQQLESLILE